MKRSCLQSRIYRSRTSSSSETETNYYHCKFHTNDNCKTELGLQISDEKKKKNIEARLRPSYVTSVQTGISVVGICTPLKPSIKVSIMMNIQGRYKRLYTYFFTDLGVLP